MIKNLQTPKMTMQGSLIIRLTKVNRGVQEEKIK